MNRLPPVVPPLLKLALVEVKLKSIPDIGRTAALLLAATGPLMTAPELITRWTPLTAMPTRPRTGRLVTNLVLPSSHWGVECCLCGIILSFRMGWDVDILHKTTTFESDKNA